MKQGFSTMKLAVIGWTIALMAGCASSPQQGELVNLAPTSTLSSQKVADGLAFTLASQDVRTAQYIAVVNTGQEQVLPLHAKQNVRKTFETALYQQMFSQGFKMTVNSNNTLTLRILDAVATVKQEPMEYAINAKVALQITAETPTGKFVKNYNGNSNRTGSFNATTTEIDEVLNTVSSRVLEEIAKDKELLTYMKGNF